MNSVLGGEGGVSFEPEWRDVEGNEKGKGVIITSIVVILIPLRIARDILWLTLLMLLLTIEHLFEELKLRRHSYY